MSNRVDLAEAPLAIGQENVKEEGPTAKQPAGATRSRTLTVAGAERVVPALAAVSNILEKLSVAIESLEPMGFDGEKAEGPLLEGEPPRGELKLATESMAAVTIPPAADDPPPT
jgi:hypothetical protein